MGIGAGVDFKKGSDVYINIINGELVKSSDTADSIQIYKGFSTAPEIRSEGTITKMIYSVDNEHLVGELTFTVDSTKHTCEVVWDQSIVRQEYRDKGYRLIKVIFDINHVVRWR